MRTKANRELTHVFRVEEALKILDDFVRVTDLRDLLKLTHNQVNAALRHLRNHKAAEALEVDGRLWWMHTPNTDDRIKHVDERTPEKGPRKPRAGRKKVVTLPNLLEAETEEAAKPRGQS